MQFGHDSHFNDKYVNKNRHNKRMIISDLSSQDYMKSHIDLSFPELNKNKNLTKLDKNGIIIINSTEPSKMNV